MDELRGLPDFSWSTPRAAILETCRRSGNRPVLLTAPSGFGKTIAAAQVASQHNGESLWLELSGQTYDAQSLCSFLVRHMGCTSEEGGRIARSSPVDAIDFAAAMVTSTRTSRGPLTIVLDDLALGDDEELDGLRQLLAVLTVAGGRLIVTSRSSIDALRDVLPTALVFDVASLRLSETEATELAASLEDIDSDRTLVDGAYKGSDGHAALFEALLRSRDVIACSAGLPAVLAGLELPCLPASQQAALVAAVLLGEGSEAELSDAVGADLKSSLRQVAGRVPLLRLTDNQGCLRFAVHDLLQEFVLRVCADGLLQSDVLGGCIETLDRRGDYSRSARLLADLGLPSERVAWLKLRGDELLAASLHSSLSALLEAIPLKALMAEPRLMLLWAERDKDIGRVEDALSRVQAAQSLARCVEDVRGEQQAWARRVYYLVLLDRPEAATEVAGQLLEAHGSALPGDLLAELEFACGTAAVLVGDLTRANEHFSSALDAIPSPKSAIRARCQSRMAVVRALMTSDFARAATEVAPLMDVSGALLSERLTIRGNLGVCLVETGRLARAAKILEPLREVVVEHLSGAFLPTLACVKAAQGEAAEAQDLTQRGVDLAIRSGDEMSVAANRIYEAAWRRAEGQSDDALIAAERAYEQLLRRDHMGLKSSAAIEVAACLLAVGDVSGSLVWLEQGLESAGVRSPRASISDAMVRAVIALRRGEDAPAAARLLVPFHEHVLSGNSNWQIAMYCRAFPELLGLFAVAIEPSELPVHMLRMILPEHAERSLTATREWLPADSWHQLGGRLLGEDELVAFQKRDGRPLCRVRLFGGLEVTVGGRVVRERDWRKRKARLLFAMLVTRHGNDVPRDQIFDYLWPDMDETRAKNNLYVSWSTMKSALMGDEDGRCPYVESVGGVCRIIAENVRCDLDDFESALAAAEAAHDAGDERAELDAYRRIADVYRGDLLPGDLYDDWFSQLRDRYRYDFCDAMSQAADLLMRAEKPADAIVFARRAIHADPLREDLYQIALRCQIAAGQRSAAVDTYMQCRSRLSEELGLDPSVETRSLYDRILAMEDRPTSYRQEVEDW